MNVIKGEADLKRPLAQILLLSAIAFATSMPSAIAHTSVVKTIPTYKSTLTEMPSTISIEFSEELMVIGSEKVNTIEITSPDGSSIALSSVEVKKSIVLATLPSASYGDGTYIVNYRVVSADGHPVSGSYELYLNSPSQLNSSSPQLENHENFFHIHAAHLYEAGVALILILLWWAYRRFNREQDQ